MIAKDEVKERRVRREIRAINIGKWAECYLIAADPSEGRKEDEVLCA